MLVQNEDSQNSSSFAAQVLAAADRAVESLSKQLWAPKRNEQGGYFAACYNNNTTSPATPALLTGSGLLVRLLVEISTGLRSWYANWVLI